MPLTQVQSEMTAFTAPTVTRILDNVSTNGTTITVAGTYNKPANCKYIKIKMVGGGGGATGTGSSLSGGNGGAGGSTTFGTSLLTAGGGASVTRAAETYGGAGGTPTINSPAISLVSLTGATGSGNQFSITTDVRNAGAPGASSPFGGAGQGGSAGGGAGPGGNAIANTGSGGGAPGNTSFGQQWTGTSGGAGAYIEALIINPLSTYSYSIGSGGTGGTAGTNGAAGGSGGSGVIIVEEYYA